MGLSHRQDDSRVQRMALRGAQLGGTGEEAVGEVPKEGVRDQM